MSSRDRFLTDPEAQVAVRELAELFGCRPEAAVLLEVPSAIGLVPLPSRLTADVIGCTRCGDACEAALYLRVDKDHRLCVRCDPEQL